MAHFFRTLILCAFFLLPSLSAKAVETYPVQGRYVCSSASPTGTNFSTCKDFADDFKTGAAITAHWQGRVNSATGDYPSLRPWTFGALTGECDALYFGRTYAQGAVTCFQSFTRSDGYTANYGFSFLFGCPYGGTRSGSSCINAPDTEYGRDPVTGEPNSPPPPACPEDQILDQGNYSGNTVQVACINSCQAIRVSQGEPQLQCDFTSTLGTCSYVYPAVYLSTGLTCAETPEAEPAAPAPTPPNTNCPQCECMESGGAWGTVNSVETCVPQGAAGSTPVKTVQPITTTTTTPPATEENPNPEPVTETVGGGGAIIYPATASSPPMVETTVENADGSTTTTKTPVSEFCAQNPTSTLCNDNTEKRQFGGSCGSYSCSGDAIQCAIAIKQHQDRCDDLAGLNEYAEAKALGDKILNGQNDDDVNDFLNPSGANVVDVGAMLTESGDYSFTSQGFEDVTFSILGQTVVVPFSRANTYLEILGYILLACSYLYALRIVGLF